MATKTPFITVTNDKGRTFAIRYLPVGARYGRANALVNEHQPQVEFWDTTHADDTAGDFASDLPSGFGPLGQFTGGRYHVTTILGESKYSNPNAGGICLDGGNAEVWSIDAGTMDTVREWLQATRARLEEVTV